MNEIKEYLLGKSFSKKNHPMVQDSANVNYAPMITIVQNDYNEHAIYETYDYMKTQKKYRYGFLVFNEDASSIVIEAMDSIEDLASLIGADEDYFDELKPLSIGNTIKMRGTHDIVTRIW